MKGKTKKIGKPNNLIVFGSHRTRGLKDSRQNSYG
jgi:hypothetical protein